MAKMNIEVNTEKGMVFGAALLAGAALWNLGATVAQEAKMTVTEKAPVVKATVRDYAEMGRAAADEKAASFLTSFAKKLQDTADNLKQQ